MAAKQIMLDGQLIHGRDRYGWWQILKLEGWDAAPEPRFDAASRANADGDFDPTVHYSSRLITLNGRLIATSPQQAEEARDRLTGLLRAGGPFTVTGANGTTKWGSARRGRIIPGAIRGRYLTFQIELPFPDPYKYGASYAPATTADAPLGVFHRGNADAWPVITVTGSMPGGYEVMLGGRLVEVLAPLVSGQPHVINMRTGRITVGGARVYGVFGICELFPVEPGMPQSFYALPRTTGSATFKVAFSDTYI